MQNDFDEKIKNLGINFPTNQSPAANYIPFTMVGSLVYVSGQISADHNGLIQGCIGSDLNLKDGYRAARFCGIALLAQLKTACLGNFGRLKQIVRLNGFVNCVSTFESQPEVINGASDLMLEIFGDKGKHTRVAVGVPSLPRGVAVEVDGLFEIEV